MVNKDKKNFKKDNQPLIKVDKGDKWYNHSYNEKLPSGEKLSNDIINKYETKATQLLIKDCQAAASSRGRSEANVAWITQIIKSGTSSDKISAVQLDSQIDPVHSLDNVKFLVSWLQKKTIREVIPVLTALKDIFVNELLPTNRKLVYFKDRPLDKIEKLSSGNQQTIDKRLILWKYEGDLKRCYSELIQALDSVCNSTVEAVVLHACRTMKDLLISRPEQENVLLTMVTNKLCLPKKTIASKTSDLLNELVEAHPNMRIIVVKEVESVMFRKNVPIKAQLYAAHFLSRILLNKGEVELAMKLLKIYFAMFKTLVKSEGENHRLMAIVMTGASRAIPYAQESIKELISEIDSLYKMVHVEKFSIALSALKVLFQILTFNKDLSDRFYSTFYRRLSIIKSSSHDVELFRLLEKVITADPVKERAKAFIKRMLQLALISTPSFAAASLILYEKVNQKHNKMVNMTLIKNTSYHSKSKFDKKFGEMDEDEHYDDADKKDEIKDEPMEIEEVKTIVREKGWLHRLATKAKPDPSIIGYDGEARNPLFANADLSADTELYQLSHHYHPSVAIYAQKIIDGDKIDYKGDPLEDYTLIRFLDRFTFKNPKRNKDRQSVLSHRYAPQGVKSIGVASKDYAKKKLDEIPLDERYLHHYASMTYKDRAEDEFDEIASVNSEEFDVIMDQFQPGEANEEFNIDYTEMFGPEKTDKDKKSKKRQADELDAMDDEGDDDDEEADFELSDDGEYDDLFDDEDDLEEDIDDDINDDDDEEEEEEMLLDEEKEELEKQKKLKSKQTKTSKSQLFDSDDDEDDENDVDDKITKDAIASTEILDDFIDEDDEEFNEKPSKKKKKIHKPKGFKRRKH